MKLENIFYRVAWFSTSSALMILSLIILLFSDNRYIIFMGGIVFILYFLEIVDLFKEAKR